MELEGNHGELQLHACRRPRGSAGAQASKVRRKEGQDESKARTIVAWQHIPSSRIYRVSRASGGKDRHSKVYTAKGLRDRRVRLSVSTAIQFYDLQDRLGFDQPSKAIEWLIKNAASAIDELPSLESFLNPPRVEEAHRIADPDHDPSYNHKSGCSSTSETSKGSVLSLSRSESRVRARERARERVSKEKDNAVGHPSLSSQTSFTELLTGGGGRGGGAGIGDTIQKHQMSTADYFSQAGIFSKNDQNINSGFSTPSPFESSSGMPMMPFNISAGDHSELQQFSILQDNIMPVSAMPAAAAGDYNLNFSISSGLAGFNRGTLQSNSQAHMHHDHNHNHGHGHLQRLSSVEGANLPFFFGSAVASAAPVDHPFPPGFDARLQLCYGDGFRHSDLKGKGKN